jgi:hypothetical protein
MSMAASCAAADRGCKRRDGRRLLERLDALDPTPRAERPHDLMLPDFERTDRS